MILKLTLSRTTYFIGRNGHGKCTGVELMKLTTGPSVIISPITSRGETANCEIAVPVEDIPALIHHMQDIIADYYIVSLPGGGYLQEAGQVQTYRRGEAIKKARRFGGKIKKL